MASTPRQGFPGAQDASAAPATATFEEGDGDGTFIIHVNDSFSIKIC